MQLPQLVNIYEFRLKKDLKLSILAHQMQNFLWQPDVQPPIIVQNFIRQVDVQPPKSLCNLIHLD